ncbi:hypothetical protein Chor_011429, partial [Crotalus horridus]
TLVAINKPCGIPVSGKPEDLTLQSVLPQLSQNLNLPQDLQVIKAPEKEGSGLVLLSSCPNTTRYLQDFYIQRKKKKDPVATYCAVTTRTPVATEGEIHTGLKLVDIDGFDLALEEHVMQKLRLREQVMFRLQLHLHLHQLLLPDGCCSSRTFLVAPPPPFFLQTLRSLGLNLPP